MGKKIYLTGRTALLPPPPVYWERLNCCNLLNVHNFTENSLRLAVKPQLFVAVCNNFFFSSCCFSVAIRQAQLFSLNGLRETPLTHFAWFFPIVWSATCFRVLRLPKVDRAYLLLVYHEKICGTNALSVMEMGPL